MKTSLRNLPKRKQDELRIVTDMIRQVVGVDKIILFGSYARGDWVEELGTNGYYKYQSDFDLLVIVDEKKLARKLEKWDRMEDNILRSALVKTPVCIITHNIQYVNEMLRQGQYFFSDISKEGILIYDSKKSELVKVKKKKSPEERQKKARKDFENWYKSANDFYDHFQYAFKRKKYKMAAFQLHQAAERYYSAILLVFTTYRPKLHDIKKLGKLAAAHDPKLITVFPKGTDEEIRLFNLLKSAYVDSRYDENYNITREELEWLAKRVSKLQKLTASICKKKIRSFTKIG
jgi:HEPN domain-containing protein/predicted nucleotidyltransferase